MNFSWEKILSSDEVVKKEFSISNKFATIILVITIFAAALVAFSVPLIGILIALLGFFYWFYLTRAKHYAFTTKRVVIVDSFLSLSTLSVDYDKITDVQVEQSFVEQLIGIGTFVVNTASTHAPQAKLPFVDNPAQLKQALDEIRDPEKQT